ncbi:MAG: YIP1 family protein [Chloroflexi bacterium]|nr:YIP1 family protein [Chloroflexota bacterium]
MLASIMSRLSRLVKRDASVVKEIRFDPKANREAAVIILVVSLVTALATALYSGSFWGTLFARFVAGILLNWLLWSYAAVFVLNNFYGVDAEFWQMARLIGYANIPMILALAGIFGCLGSFFAGAGWILALVMAFFMIRDAFELSTERTIITIAVGWAVVLLLNIPLNLLFRTH